MTRYTEIWIDRNRSTARITNGHDRQTNLQRNGRSERGREGEREGGKKGWESRHLRGGKDERGSALTSFVHHPHQLQHHLSQNPPSPATSSRLPYPLTQHAGQPLINV